LHENFSFNIGGYVQEPVRFLKDSNAGVFSKKLAAIHNASLKYNIAKTDLSVGRLEVMTPLTDSAVLRGKPSLELRNHWYSDKDRLDWWWITPSAYEGILLESYDIENLKIYASVLNRFKDPASDHFSDSLLNVGDFGKIYIAGVEYKLQDSMKLQFYDLYADNFANTYYIQADYLKRSDSWGYFTSLQYLNQKDSGNNTTTLDSSLVGSKVGGYYQGWQLWAALSETGADNALEENGVVTPFKGMVAFTNSFVLRNALPPRNRNLYNTDGAYKADTLSKKIALEYLGSYDKLSELSCMISATEYRHKNIGETLREYDFDLHYDLHQITQGLGLNIKASKINSENFFRVNGVYNF
jgi:hypothetical protein